MFDKRSGPLSEDVELVLNQCFRIITPLGSVPSGIILNPSHHRIRGTVQNAHCMHAEQVCTIAGLAGMPRKSIQYKQFLPREYDSGKKERDDLFRQDKMFVLQQQTLFKNTADVIKLLRRICSRAVAEGYNAAKLRSEVQMMASSSEKTVLRNSITKRALARARRAEKQDRICRNPVVYGYGIR